MTVTGMALKRMVLSSQAFEPAAILSMAIRPARFPKIKRFMDRENKILPELTQNLADFILSRLVNLQGLEDLVGFTPPPKTYQVFETLQVGEPCSSLVSLGPFSLVPTLITLHNSLVKQGLALK